ncbi:T-cell receptor gamma chain V region PT-gamma-1/2 [Camelus ferus]|nr:T-cell receptor gamma chain V region PT-gamma-1/2 [Camelus ferus]
MEGDKTSVTMKIGSSFEMTCDLNTQSVNYIHWYKFGDRTAPRRLFYYDVYYKMTSYDSGIDRKKSRAYEGAEKKNKLLISNLEDSDSGTYRCAIWEQHGSSDLLRAALEIVLWLPRAALVHSTQQPLPHFPSQPPSPLSKRSPELRAHPPALRCHSHLCPPPNSHTFS